MDNKAMERMLQDCECVDVNAIGKQTDTPGVFELNHFPGDDMDYSDAKTESWIWSIGRHVDSGQILASTDARFYQNGEYECLWLR